MLLVSNSIAGLTDCHVNVMLHMSADRQMFSGLVALLVSICLCRFACVALLVSCGE